MEFTITTVHDATNHFSHSVKLSDIISTNLHAQQPITPVYGGTSHFVHVVKLADGGSGSLNGEVLDYVI